MLKQTAKKFIHNYRFLTLSHQTRFNQKHEGGKKDGFDYLIKDHDEFKQLFKRYDESDSLDSRAKYANQLIRELSKHAAVEEEYIYPLFRKHFHGMGDMLADFQLTDHTSIKFYLVLLEKYEPTIDKQLHEKLMKRLKHVVEDHIKVHKFL